MKKIISLAVFSLLFFGCQSDDATVVYDEPEQQQPPTDPEDNNPPAQPVAVAFEEVASGLFQTYSSMFVLPMGNYALNSTAEWNAFLTYPTVNQQAPLNVTPDFSTYTYIAVRHSFKSQLNSDIKVYVQSITQFEGTITVKFVRTDAEPDDIMMTIEGQPYQIVRIPHTTLPVVFEQVNE